MKMKTDNLNKDIKKETLVGYFEESIRKERRKKNRLSLCRDLLITAAVIFVLFSLIAGIAVVQRDSMNPGLNDGSVTLFYRLCNTYKRNDIVIFKLEDKGELLIKRVVAIAGDTVDIDDKTGELLVKNVVQKENTVIGKTYSRNNGIEFPYAVPDGYVFVLGDNREASVDSRDFGAISTGSLIGKVFFEMTALTD